MMLVKLSAGGAAAAQAVYSEYAVELNVEVSNLGRDLFEKSAMRSHLPEDARERAALPFIYLLP